MKVIVLAFILIVLSHYAEARRAAATGVLTKVTNALKVTNFGLGTYSRSSIISAVSQALRGDDEEDVRENLNQAIVTLAVLDIGGGALLPITEEIVESISKDATFKATSDAWKDYNTKIRDQLDTDLKNLDDAGVKRVLKQEKAKVLSAFENDVTKLEKVPAKAKTFKLIKKAQKWLKVKSVAKVLGPIFDIVGIGIDAWSLSSTISDCNDNPATCNYGEIASASLGIASSIVGIATFIASIAISSSVLGPVGAVVGLVLAIGATLIELFYEPPVDYARLEREKRFRTMMELDRYSRYQLYTANKFLFDNDVDRDDLYVVNQGYLPMWNVLSPKPVLQFGKTHPGAARSKEYVQMKCEDPKLLGQSDGNNVCEYLIDGNMLEKDGFILGYGFYGFTKKSRTYLKGGSLGAEPPYGGSIILMNTDQVMPSVLSENNLNANLRGFEIRTDIKTNDGEAYDDLVSIENMVSIAAGQKIVVRTGAGNDALNIGGIIGPVAATYQNILDADLGSEGHNTLSFNGYTAESRMLGVHFDATTGIWSTFGNGYEHQFGTIKNVEIFGGSKYSDKITLHATKKGENGFDFTVIKRKGSAHYKIDVDALASQTEARHFKIIDSTGGSFPNDVNCHRPLIQIINFDMEASSNDVLYQGGKIKIYGFRKNVKKRSYLKKREVKIEKRGSDCSGESWGVHKKGGRDGKVLLATVTIHSKCQPLVSSSNIEGGCMAYTRSMENLDLVFYEGHNVSLDFSTSFTLSDKSDLAHMVCPSTPVEFRNVINMAGSTGDTIVLSSSKFLEPCDIDGVWKRMIIEKLPWKVLNGVQKYQWEIHFLNNPKFLVKIGEEGGWRHYLQGVEKIVNEYGEIVVNLRRTEANLIDLYHEYTKAAMKLSADRFEATRSPEIKTNLLECLPTDPNSPKAEICE